MVLRRPFDQRQRQLQDKVLVLASQVEKALRETVDSLKKRDKAEARRLLEEERQLHQSRVQIESDTLALLSTQQPTAGDLRFLATVFQVSLELGGVAYQTRQILKTVLELEDRPHPEPFGHIVHMAGLVEKMLHQSMAAFSDRDVELAQTVAVRDYEIDDLYVHITRRLLAVSRTDCYAASQAIHLSHIAHQLERIGDRATNICEWVIYAVTGHIVEMNTEFEFAHLKTVELPSLRSDV
jgi:phosphate transport system protein